MSYLIENKELIQVEMKKLRNNVTLKIFTDFKTQDDGTRIRRCMACDSTVNLLNALADFSFAPLSLSSVTSSVSPRF